MKKLILKIKNIGFYLIYFFINPIRLKNKTKIFCIGMNKTGTTSLKKSFTDLGFIVSTQWRGERLLPDYKAGNFSAIVKFIA